MSPDLDPSPRSVTVLGAGVAGLTAAYHLEQLGFEVTVLEGSARVGGRIHSHRFGTRPGAPVAELGAMRIPVSHRRTLACVEQLGLGNDLVPFHSLQSDDRAAKVTGAGSGARLAELEAELRADPSAAGLREETLTLAAQLAVLVDAVAPRSARAQLRSDLGRQLFGLLDSVDVVPYRAPDRSIDLHRVLNAHPQLRRACRGDLGSFLDDVLTETGDGLLRIRGGMGRIVDRLAARLSGRVLTGHEVVGLHAREEGSVVEVRQNGRTRSWRSRYVVCTLPFSVLRRLPVSGFSNDKLDVVRAVRYVPATKVALHCREAFWHRTGMVEGAIGSGGILRQTYYPAVDGDPELGAVLLASYAIGEDADVLDRMTPAVRVAAVLAELATIHPELRRPGMVRGAASVAWSRHRWTQGGCAVRWGKDVTETEEERRRAARPEKSVYFAGEHTSSTPAWIEGALQSADTAVDKLALEATAYCR